ncbi:hypothetical protein JCM15060_10120 [Halanaerobaculum tunisiense]
MNQNTTNDNLLEQLINQEISIQEYLQSLFKLATEKENSY